ncbi:MAG TPA: hypothetical protein VKJ65_04325 [Phycisphaerae bacterium]|nr:hypothetical protein [Phycisphaerae bacterium]
MGNATRSSNAATSVQRRCWHSFPASKGADNVDYQNMINVLDVLQQLDITKVGLATAQEN